MNKSEVAYHYSRLMRGETQFFIVYPDGYMTDRREKGYQVFDVVSGSFNPLHAAHKEMYGRIIWAFKMKPWNTVFEISITSAIGKDPVSLEDLCKRLEQFEWYAPVAVTNSALFKSKCGVFPDATFWMGADVGIRFLEAHDHEEISAMEGQFCIIPRGDIVLPVLLPQNVKVAAQLSERNTHMSSTELRRNNG